MKRSISNIIFGLLFLCLGITVAFKAFGFDFNIFFDGWWTLFIIIPSITGLFQKNDRTSSFIGIGVGILLLLTAQDIIDWGMFINLLIALVFIMVGFSILFKKKSVKYNSSDHYTSSQPGIKNYSVYFGGKDVRLDNHEFTGATMSVAFGGIELDLSRAIIQQNVVIDAFCALGGIDIRVPNNVKVEVDCTPILGGVDNKVSAPYSDGKPVPTIYINATCILGGIDVK